MKKIICFSIILSFIIITIIHNYNIVIADSKIDINPKYKEEIVKRCQTFEEYENNKLNSNLSCLTNFDETFTPQKVDIAIDFAKKIKYVYRTQDFITLSNILPYPLEINNYKNQNIVIKSKQEFLKLDKEILLNKKIFNKINDNELFWNYKGFMLGNGAIWFWIDNDISNVTINLE